MGELPPPVAVSFLVLILASVVIMVSSRLLDQFWSGVLPARWLYYIISAPGVAIHECTHIAACLLTGAKVTKVVLFSKTGGSVTYQPPAVPVLGNVIIGTAPIFGIPLVLAGMTWIFGTYLGCELFSTVPALDSFASAGSLLSSAAFILYQNLIAQFNGWFLLYLYLTVSLVLSLSPSTQDLKNAIAGLCIIIAIGLLIIATAFAPLIAIMTAVMTLFSTGLALGLIFEIFAILVSIPFFLISILRRT